MGLGQPCCSSCPVNLEEILRLISLIPLEPPFPAGKAWASVVSPLCLARVCHLPAPWHKAFVRSDGRKDAGSLCRCWVALQSPVCGNLRRAIAPGHGRSCCSHRCLSHTGQSPGKPRRYSHNLCLSWRWWGWGVNGTRPG